MDGLSPHQFKRVHMNDIPYVEDLQTLNFLLYDIDIVDGSITGELSRRSVQKYENTIRLLRYSNHIRCVSNINAVFQCFCCPNCDNFVNKTFSLEQRLITCSERAKNNYPRNVHQTSNQRNSLWQAGFFRYQLHKSTKILSKLSKVQFRIDLCPRRDLQRHEDKNVHRKACYDFSIHFFKPC